MNFLITTIVTLASVVVASPTGTGDYTSCTPGTYSCDGAWGWQVCNTDCKWVRAGDCPPHTICKFYEPSHSPYCVPHDFQFP